MKESQTKKISKKQIPALNYEIDLSEMYHFLNTKNAHKTIHENINQAINDSVYSFIDKLKFSIYWKDTTGKYLGCNQYMLDMIGFTSRTEIVGKTDQDLVWAEHAIELRNMDLQVMQTGETTVMEEVGYIFKKSQKRLFSSTKQPLFDDKGQIIGILGVSADITEQKKIIENLEQETQKRVLAETEKYIAAMFSGSTSHDIKNELQMLSFLTEQLELATEKIRKANISNLSALELKWLYENPKKIIQVKDKIDQLASYANQYLRDITLGIPDIDQKYSKKTNILRSLIEAISIFSYRNIQIHNQIEKNFEYIGAEMSIYKILVNLISNAIRQIEKKKKGAIFISCEENLDYNILKIKDTAGGLTQKKIDELLISFQEKTVEGTGFGLACSQITMEKMGGKLEARLVEEDCIEFLMYFQKIK